MSESPVAGMYDVVVAGSGAGGLAAAVTAARAGLDVLVLEKADVVGGTTARSGGVLWLPGNHLTKGDDPDTDRAQAREYIRELAGNGFDADRVDAFLNNAADMARFFEDETEVAFAPQPQFPDYHPEVAGASEGGRSVVAAPYDGRELGGELKRLRPPLREITFVGMMFNASQEVQHFFRATRSLKSAIYVAKRLMIHGWELARHGRAMRLTNGNALAARLFASALRNGVEVRTGCGISTLMIREGEVRGVVTEDGETIEARRGVVLATGGFPRDLARQMKLFPHVHGSHRHSSPAPETNTGGGLCAAEEAGASVETRVVQPAAWIPVSLVPDKNGPPGVFPHLVDRYKPGLIAVTPDGRRFVNEADSYHVFGQAMLRECEKDGEVYAWLLADSRALNRYGLGMAKPFPVPHGHHLRSGYLKKAAGLEGLSREIGCDPDVLTNTIYEYNLGARNGEDRQFGKGSTPYNRYLGDSGHSPNPCVAPFADAPFYAVRLVMGDLGTFAGLRADAHARVLGADGSPIRGLYAAGNDLASVMGGAYPAGGITLGPAMTFGYIAAHHMAAEDSS
ncbi:FAD-dependent oxidoreductase [Aurantiacibacter zhengii]|uniref:FAD-dependent oxidoreductase n=1 Tax=Aurantiacibacter zhengii TaxID=2307003 RepID=A0A418NTE0_9SPHN|nr:FAD-dependent oxidoreductase [Aurantiacibacter zhengii]RIV86816.1 FAD-dependent oxidoreductase [Aurantiacibacter zhengii]